MLSVILLAILVSLPYFILKDSKKRFGKYSWGWAAISFVTYAAAIGQIGKGLSVSGYSNAGDLTLNVSMLIGGLVGAWVGMFAIYRAATATRKKAEEFFRSKTHADEIKKGK